MQQPPSTVPLTSITNQCNEKPSLDGNGPAVSKRVVEVTAEEDTKYQIKTPPVSDENITNEATTIKKENE